MGCDGKIDLMMGAGVKDCAVANRSDICPTERLPGTNVCGCARESLSTM